MTSHLTRLGLRTILASSAVVMAVVAGAAPAKADPVNLVQNGNFANTSATYTYNGTTVGTETTNSNLANWQFTGCNASNCGFSFLANSNLGSTGFYDAQDGHISTPGSNPGALPVAGSNAFLSDASYETQAMYQAVGGLTVGDSYTLKFYQASFQQSGYSGGFTANWAVGLGNGSYTTANYGTQNSGTMTNPSGGSSSWTQQTMTFIANATNETLFFFATASSGANPPFLLLDGVSLTDNATAVPEPASIALVAAGLLGMLAVRRRRSQG